MVGMLSSVVMVVCLVASSCGRKLNDGEIGFRTAPLTSLMYRIEATDGRSTLEAVVSRDRGLITCRMHDSMVMVDTVLGDPNVTVKTLGTDEIQSTWTRCQLSDFAITPLSRSPQPAHLQAPVRRARAPPTTPDYSDLPFPADYNTGLPEGPDSSVAIVPGTKWCGKGNVARNYDDLGVHKLTDACCRTHDHCPYYIPTFTIKYNYFNIKPWTLSYCDCDHALYDCLKQVNNTNANAVGEIFFGVLSVECFEFGKGRYCAKYNWTQLWCEKYETGPMAIMRDAQRHWHGQPADNQVSVAR